MSNEIAIGTEIDSFLVEFEVGHGGMGVVYRCHDDKTNRPVALKILHPYYRGDRELTRRFEREAEVIATLTHPNIAKLYQFGKWEERPYIVMEWINGVNLQSLLQEKYQLNLEYAIELIHQISGALAYAHDMGIVHRDLKPSNIMVRPDDTVSLIDFGLAWLDDTASITRPNSLIGTPLYMSPEQIQGDKVDTRTDIYSLGTIFYEMLLGSPPFGEVASQAVFHQHLYGEPPPLSEKNPTIPISVETVIFKALQKSPNQRFASAYEFSSALANPQNLHELQPTTTHKNESFSRALIAIGIGIVAVITLGLTYLGFAERTPEKIDTNELSPLITVYDDQLPESWINWSWGADFDHRQKREVQSGTDALSIKYTHAWGAYYIHSVDSIDLTEITKLRFWINGGPDGGQLIRVMLVSEDAAYNGNWNMPWQTIGAPKNRWKLIEIPLENLGSPLATTGIAWQDGAGEPQPVYFLDQIEFVKKSQ